MVTDVEPGLVDAVSADVLADQQAAFEVAFVAFGQGGRSDKSAPLR